MKRRNGTKGHYWADTIRGTSKVIASESNMANTDAGSTRITSFNSNGFSLGTDQDVNGTGQNYCTWTFRKAPGFFDIVTYSGDGNSSQTINHSLGCEPGLMIIKRLDQTDNWYVYHRSLGATKFLYLNSNTNASSATTGFLNNTAPTSSNFTVGSAFYTNSSSGEYIAYLFAHDCADFGASSNEDVIQCGSYTGTGSGLTVNLGFEPQWLLVKNTSSSNTNWHIFDTMRGLPANQSGKYLEADTSNSEANQQVYEPNATGFQVTSSGVDWNLSGDVYAYVAIRRPHKPPSAGTDVFASQTTSPEQSSWTPGFAPDALFTTKPSTTSGNAIGSRLTGTQVLQTESTQSEQTGSSYWSWDEPTGTVKQGFFQSSSDTGLHYAFKRAPGFFDTVAYDGTGSATTVGHNLGVAPELLIVKRKNGSVNWYVQSSELASYAHAMELNNADGAFGPSTTLFPSTAPTATVFRVGDNSGTNQSGGEYTAYLFATSADVSKVGSYTGTGNNLNVDCGFAAGARFILIKRTDSAGDWYVWDSTRGIVAGNDPYIRINEATAQVTSNDYVDPLDAGFTVTSSAPAGLNASSGTYLFLAIA